MIQELHQLNPLGCLTLCLASQTFLLQDSHVVLHNYLLDTILVSAVIHLSMDDLIDPAMLCVAIPPAYREKCLLQEHVEAELVRDHQNIHLVMIDAITTADLNLRW